MRKLLFGLLTSLAAVHGWTQAATNNLVLVAGGAFKNANANFHRPGLTVASFYIGRYEVTQKEWAAVMSGNPSKFRGDNLPVETVSWYDCIEYCNQRSAKEGLQNYYNIYKGMKDPNNDNELDTLKWTITVNPHANGYRLPTEAEWEYAAGGGQQSRNFIYSGSDDLDQVAWFYKNSGDTVLTGYWSLPAIEHNHNRTQPVGGRLANELGLHDMSGNVREWCWDWHPADETGPSGRIWRGGGWLGGDFCCATAFRASFEASGKGPDQGFRVCRNP